MYQNLANNNRMVSQFQGYMAQNPTTIPFQQNQLINNNVHILSNLNTMLSQHKNIQQNNTSRNNSKSRPSTKKGSTKVVNIIEEMLKPQKIQKHNPDVVPNSKTRNEENKKQIEITNAPYKNIIFDKRVTKAVKDVKLDDLVVHKAVNGIDDNRVIFGKNLDKKKEGLQKINEELDIEFCIENYDRNKKKFAFRETWIRNLNFEQNSFDESKQDYIGFYKDQQKKNEKDAQLCDQVIRQLINDDIIDKSELLSDVTTTSTTTTTTTTSTDLIDMLPATPTPSTSTEHIISEKDSVTTINVGGNKPMSREIKKRKIPARYAKSVKS